MKPELIDKNTILVVDDNPTNIDVLFEHLISFGFEVFVAGDGEDAISQAQYAQPDLILLDVMMPGMNGFEACRRLKKDAETKDIPVIFMTALSDMSNKLEGFEAGAVDYVTKPIHSEEVLARVTTHLTLRKLQEDLIAQNAQLQQEIQQRIQTEKALHRQTVELQKRNEELDAFAVTLAHDLKSPLGVVIGFAEILRKTPDLPNDLRSYSSTILEAGTQMNEITDELLLLARIRDTDIELNPVDMNSIIQKSLARIKHMTNDYQAEIVVSARWPVGLGYAPWLEEVWVNYLTNAMKYGGQPPQIELGATEQDDGQICFWVRDNGQGLTQEEQDRLFAEFVRLHNRKIQGYGLGLSIVQRIITKLGGHVGVESQKGQGSTFYFTLQRADILLPVTGG